MVADAFVSWRLFFSSFFCDPSPEFRQVLNLDLVHYISALCPVILKLVILLV